LANHNEVAIRIPEQEERERIMLLYLSAGFDPIGLSNIDAFHLERAPEVAFRIVELKHPCEPFVREKLDGGTQGDKLLVKLMDLLGLVEQDREIYPIHGKMGGRPLVFGPPKHEHRSRGKPVPPDWAVSGLAAVEGAHVGSSAFLIKFWICRLFIRIYIRVFAMDSFYALRYFSHGAIGDSIALFPRQKRADRPAE
jgi:hypothetical protein